MRTFAAPIWAHETSSCAIAHGPSRLPSRSAATIPPSFSGSNPRFALQRDANALQRPASRIPCLSSPKHIQDPGGIVVVLSSTDRRP